MRNMTITRRKSFVGCAMKDQVYIRDAQSPELTIDGVPCRKIGDIKNGECKTFQIEDGEQQVFLIVDKLSKDYCNATVTIPEGQEDITLSGIHKFVYGSNPFCFDGVQLSPAQLAKQKQGNRKGAIITVAASILGVIIGLFLSRGLFLPEAASPKVFTEEGFEITLTDAFEPLDESGFHAFYRSGSALVFALREDKDIFGDITLEEYSDLVLEANGKTGFKLNQEEGFLWFEFTDTPEGEEEYYYIAVCCKSADAFWIVNFATPAENQAEYKETFLDWARSINVA